MKTPTKKIEGNLSERIDQYIQTPMGSTICFYTFGSNIELNGKLFKAGELTADLLNIPDDYVRDAALKIIELHGLYDEKRKPEDWGALNSELGLLCDRLRKFEVFKQLLTEKEEQIFEETKLLIEKYGSLPKKKYSLTKKNLAQSIKRDELLASGITERDVTEIPSSMLLYPGDMEQKWRYYQLQLDRYLMVCHDIEAFVITIRNFISFLLSKLDTNSPENYAAALYEFYNDARLAEKLIVNPLHYGSAGYWTHDTFRLAYVPRRVPNGKMTICQEHVTGSFQGLMKTDYMLALNSGHNIRRCKICGKYFLLTTGAHALYCEGECPHAPGFTCRQFGTIQVQKELAKDIPKVQVKVRAFERIAKDAKRGAITKEEERMAKDYIRDELYAALRDSRISVEDFEKSVSSESVYEVCGINRISKPRGRPKKTESGEAT